MEMVNTKTVSAPKKEGKQMEAKEGALLKYIKAGIVFALIAFIESIMLLLAMKNVIPSSHQAEMISLYKTGFYCTLTGSAIISIMTLFIYAKYKKYMKDKDNKSANTNSGK